MLTPKFEIGQLVYFIYDNKLHSRTISTRVIIENEHDDWDCTEEQKRSFTPCGKTRIDYYINGSVFPEHLLFTTKEELADNLINKYE